MEAIIFSGPTISPTQAAEIVPGACCLGPVRRGDVFRMLRHQPKLICILDGLFGATLPVWHKELLWALKQGVRLFGAASMGALRAAELAPFGMVGVGRIFEAFQREELENEDEVTVMHAGTDRDYRATSEALVDIRATLAAAEAARVIDGVARARLVELAQNMFYADRSYVTLLQHAEGIAMPRAARAELAAFLSSEQNRVKLKRSDAHECLAMVHRELAARAGAAPRAPTAAAPEFDFSYTDAFDAFVSEETALASTVHDGAPKARELPSELLVEELQLLGPEVFEPLLRQATSRALRSVLAKVSGPAHDAGPFESGMNGSGSQTPSDVDELEGLLEELDLTPDAHHQWMLEESKLQRVEEQTQLVLQAQFAPLLRALGDYPRVAQRARRKLALCGSTISPLPAAQVPDIWRAYFEGVLNVDVPEDLEEYARRVGFRDAEQLLGAVARELEYRRLG